LPFAPFLAGCASTLLDPIAPALDASAVPVEDAAVAPVAAVDLVVATLPDAASAVPDAAVDLATGCPEDSVAIESFCIDRYEAPNAKGASPLAMQTAPDGEKWCAARGKRLCSEAEWLRACQGPSMNKVPYGDTWIIHTCNDDKIWKSPDWGLLATWPSAAAMAEAQRLYQGDPSGSRTGCVSDEGVYDLTGNVAEWVTRSYPHTNNYPHVMKGCYWSGCYMNPMPNCASTNPAHPGEFRTYEAGFRCCKNR
jgi:hypothetical protein